jgi:WYL domain
MTITQIRPLPVPWAPLERALRQRRAVQVSYHGRERLVCPHALGWKNHRPLLLGYQVGGQTSSGTLPADPRKRWRCMFVDEIDDVVITDSTTRWQTADNYNYRRPFNAIDHVVVAIGPGDLPGDTEPIFSHSESGPLPSEPIHAASSKSPRR